MAKEIDKIIQSKTAPKSNNVLWDDGENLKINRSGKWESTTSNPSNITEQLKDLGIEYYDVVLNITQNEIDRILYDNEGIVDYQIYENLEPLFKKANKALNVYLVITSEGGYTTIFKVQVYTNPNSEYPDSLTFVNFLVGGGGGFDSYLQYRFERFNNTYSISVAEA